MHARLTQALDTWRAAGHLRHLRHHPVASGLLNLSGNDYLGLATDADLRARFEATAYPGTLPLASSSSRLLTGNFAEHEALEDSLQQAFRRPALVFNSGYHMNAGIIPALANERTLVLSDELIHASMIDGIRLSRARRGRYPHQDLAALERQIAAAADEAQLDTILVVTESLFSMEGDITDLAALVALKRLSPKVMLYVDEAHAVGVFGARGLGLAEAAGVMDAIDCLLGTFGKALASQGGYLICDATIREYLINTARPLIFSTALPPLNMAWSRHVFVAMQDMPDKRRHLAELALQVRTALTDAGLNCPGKSHIVPVISPGNHAVSARAESLRALGFHVLPIRAPTVPKGRERLRLSLTADLTRAQLLPLIEALSM